jgi:hypothetical protein
MSVVSEQEREAELPERWNAKAKTDEVLRVLRGESVDAVSRELRVPAHELEVWRRTLLAKRGGRIEAPARGSARCSRRARGVGGEHRDGDGLLVHRETEIQNRG